VREPPGDGGGRAAAVEALPESVGDLLLHFLLALASLAVLRALLGRGFLAHRARPGRAEPPLWGVPEIVGVLGAYIVSSLILGLPFLPVIHPSSPFSAGSRAVGLLAYHTVSWAFTLGLIVYIVRRNLGQPLSTLGLRPVPWRALAGCVPLYLLLLLPIGFVVTLWYLLLKKAGLPIEEQDLLGTFRDAASRRDPLAFAAFGISAVIIAPVCEEIFFRGFFFGALRETRGPAVAAIVSSAVFAVVHHSLSASAAIFLVGLALAGIYHRTASLYPAMCFHALFNGAALLVATLQALGSAP
jgi:membrane protease YdiL (CAAX protease family)